jgi:hypothetical protein
MDDFGLGKAELNGSLMSIEFGPGGRLQQLWVMDPNNPEENEEFQFVAPPIAMGEEFAEDYFPGTILLGARTDPDEPWIVSRNAHAEQIGEEDDASNVVFRYDFSFLEELEAIGRFYELPGRVPQIVWELTIRNQSRRSVEIGELGFPLALNNVLDGFPRDDRGTREMFHDRTHVHKFIAGSASYVLASRMHGLPPGLLIYPGGDTRWEFYNHVPSSLNSTFQWEGVPVVYVHSRAAIEREGWPTWFYGHSSIVLEKGESRRYEMRFAPFDRYFTEGVASGLKNFGRPTIQVMPSAVAPADIGITMEVSGSKPTRFWSDPETEMDSDSDEDGGQCFIQPSQPGTVRIGFEDTSGRESQTQLLFTAPIADLIAARAEWIVENQVVADGPMKHAIVTADNESFEQFSDLRHFTNPYAIKCSLADALFLAEKNTVYPVEAQIKVLDEYLDGFFERRVRNPLDGSVGCVFPSATGAAACFGYPHLYPLTALLYGSMAQIARGFGGTARSETQYLQLGAETALNMWGATLSDQMLEGAIPLMSNLESFAAELAEHGLPAESEKLLGLIHQRWERLARKKYAFAPAGMWDADGFAEILSAARYVGDLDLKERVFRCLMAGKSASPCWWWYGSDKRWGLGLDGNDAALDNGELCLGAPTVANSALLFSLFSRDYAHMPDSIIRMAFGGMLSVWALVREDGAAGMGFCPDAASGHFGMSPTTADVGIALYEYIRSTGSFVLPALGTSMAVFGCRFEVNDERDTEHYSVRPWDGVGRRVVVRQISLDVETTCGSITELRFDASKRKARIALTNGSTKELKADIIVRGLWGRECKVAGQVHSAREGAFRIEAKLSALDTTHVDIEVCE